MEWGRRAWGYGWGKGLSGVGYNVLAISAGPHTFAIWVARPSMKDVALQMHLMSVAAQPESLMPAIVGVCYSSALLEMEEEMGIGIGGVAGGRTAHVGRPERSWEKAGRARVRSVAAMLRNFMLIVVWWRISWDSILGIRDRGVVIRLKRL